MLLLVVGIVLGMLLPQARSGRLAGAAFGCRGLSGGAADRKDASRRRTAGAQRRGGAGAYRLRHARVFDGIALALGKGEHGSEPPLPLAIVLHRIPIGLSVWWLLRRVGTVWSVIGLCLIAIATAVGYGVSAQVFAHAGGAGMGVFQSVVAGALLHVVVHEEEGRSDKFVRYEGLGGLLVCWFCGFSTVSSLPTARAGGSEHGADAAFAYARECAGLLVAYLSAGLIGCFSFCGSGGFGRGSALAQSVRGVLFGLPLPICSCGVFPVYRSLIARGVWLLRRCRFWWRRPNWALMQCCFRFRFWSAADGGADCLRVCGRGAGGKHCQPLFLHIHLPNAIAAESPATTRPFGSARAPRIRLVMSKRWITPHRGLCSVGDCCGAEPLLRIEW